MQGPHGPRKILKAAQMVIIIVSAVQKEIGVKKDPTLQNTQVFSLCSSEVKVLLAPFLTVKASCYDI